MISRTFQLIFPVLLFTVLIGCGGGKGVDNPVSPYGPPKQQPPTEEPTPNIPYPVPEGPLPDPIDSVYFDISTNREGHAILPGFSLAPKRSNASLPMKISVVESDGDPLRHIIIRRILLGEDFALIVWDPTGFYNPRIIHSATLTRQVSFADERTAMLTEYLGKENPATTNIGFSPDSIDISVGLDRISQLEQSVISSYLTYFTDNYLLYDLSQLLASNMFGGQIVRFNGTYTRWNLPAAISTLTNEGSFILMGGFVDTSAQKLSTFQMGADEDDADDNYLTNSFITPRIPTDYTNCFVIFSSFMQVAAGTNADAVASSFENVFLTHPIYSILGDEQRYAIIFFRPIVGIDTGKITAPDIKVQSMVIVLPLDPRTITIDPMDNTLEFNSGITEIYKATANYTAGAKYNLAPVYQVDNWFRNRVITNVDPILPGDVIAHPGQGLLPSVTLLAELDRFVSITHYIPDYFDDSKLRLDSNILLITPEGGSVTNLPPDLTKATATPAEGRPPLQVIFDATQATDPDGTIISYEWNFGNPDVPGGGQMTGALVQHTYASPGVRTAILTVKDDGIPQRIIQKQFAITITANQPPVAVIDVDTQSGRAPLTVNFSAMNSYDPDGQISSVFWDFGDGQFSQQTIVQHVYTEDGTYIVTLTVTDDGPSPKKSDIETVQINVLPMSTNREPIASFIADPESGEVPLTVQFDSSASYDPDGDDITYEWNFGDSAVIGGGISHEPNPVHVYNTSQTATVTLVVTDNGDPPMQASQQKSIEVLPVSNQPPVAVITYNPDAGQEPLTVTFSGADSSDPDGEITGYSWNFGDPDYIDGGTAFGAEVQHTYESEGVFDVTLTVSDNGAVPLQDQETVQVVVGNTRPTAVIQVDHDTGYYPLTVHFDGSGSSDVDGDSIASYLWDFDTGDQTYGPQMSYTFNEAGTYNVKLTVTDDGVPPLTGEATKTINVTEPPPNAPPVVVIKTDVNGGDPPLTVNFNCTDGSHDPDGDDIIAYEWDFGDMSGTSTDPNPTYTYETTGAFLVTCTLTDDGTPQKQGQDHITIYCGVNRPPVAVAKSDVTYGVYPLTVQFDGTDSYDPDGFITSYSWDFGTGDNSNEPSPQYTFNDPGEYVVILMVTDDNDPPAGDSDQLTIYVQSTLNQPPVADIWANPTTGKKPLKVMFNAKFSSDPDGNITAYHWNFGDPDVPGGGESTDKIASHTYNSSGLFTVTLTVWDDGVPPLSDDDTVQIEVTD